MPLHEAYHLDANIPVVAALRFRMIIQKYLKVLFSTLLPKCFPKQIFPRFDTQSRPGQWSDKRQSKSVIEANIFDFLEKDETEIFVGI